MVGAEKLLWLVTWLICFPSQILLHLAKGLFEDTTKLEVVINKVMQQSMELIPCESCTVLLLDQDCKEVSREFNKIFASLLYTIPVIPLRYLWFVWKSPPLSFLFSTL